MKLGRLGLALATTAALAFSAPVIQPAAAQQPPAPTPGARSMPNAVPSANTPAVNDGDVRTIAKVGSTMVIGGTFTQVDGSTRNHIAAFNVTTGTLTSFAPSADGDVNTIIPGPTANTVYIGGKFSTLGGTPAQKLALVNISTGAVLSSFNPAYIGSGEINDLYLEGNRLYLAGSFPKVGGVDHAGLASLNASTGALDPFMSVQLAGHHNDTGGGAQGAEGPWGFDVTPSGDRMIVMGNFKTADGLLRDQVVMIDLTGGSAAVSTDWATNRYSPYCFNWAFDSYVRGVSFSPDGSYLVVSATGGPNAGTLCDATARFETYSTGTDLQPTWVTETGGDTVWATEITDSAIFVGGHQRWSNNPNGSDSAGPGAVPRPGLEALDPTSGRPLQWNPGRNPPGKSVYAILATSEGIWVGSNTDWIGNFHYKRPKIAMFPYAGGADIASDDVGQLPGSVYVGGTQSSAGSNVLYRVNAGGPAIQSTDGGPDWSADDGTSNPLRNDGSNSAGWEPVGNIDSTVPSTTPAGVFDSERWDPSDDPEMDWQFPVAAGTPIDVRVFLANRCDCTENPGQRIFDVTLNGQPWLTDEDIADDVGDDTGTMKSMTLTAPASGIIEIKFLHKTENTLVDGFEIVRTGGGDNQSNVLYRVNSGGSAVQSLDSGPNWTADDGNSSAFHNAGSNAAGYPSVGSVDGTVPASTPSAVFDSERWDPTDDPEMNWRFPVTAGTPIEVRVFLANRCDCTQNSGQRIFDVTLDGQPWLTNEDIAADVGHNRGTMKSMTLNAPSSGIVSLGFVHKTENPLVNGIEIVRTDVAPPPPDAGDQLQKIDFDGSTASAPATVDNGAVVWSQTRGAFMVGNKVFYGYTDGFLYSRTYDGSSFGPAQKIDPYHDPAWADVDNHLGGTFDGASPSLYGQMPNVTGMYYANGRLYYTLFGDSNLRWRWFSPDSGIVDERSTVVTSSVSFSNADGMFMSGGFLYYVTKSDGALRKVAFSGGQVTGTSSVVSSPATDGVNWSNRSLFLYNGPHVNTPPTAAFSADCPQLSCDFDATTSVDPDGSITSYAWDFGDGGTANGPTPTHAYTSGGDHDVQLTVTDNDGATDTVTHTVTTTGPPNEDPTAVFTSDCTYETCVFDATTSSDPEGAIADYDWDFGDGQSGTGASPQHQYASVGDFDVTLTVTDSDGATDMVTHTVTTTEPPESQLAFVAADHTDESGKKVKALDVPAAAQAGDTMLMFFTQNTGVTWTGPTGVTGSTQLDSATNAALTSTVWEKTLTNGDLGSTVQFNTSGYSKGQLNLVVYRGANGSVPITVARATDTSTASHTTANVNADAGDWVVSAYVDKSDATTSWTAPAGLASRDSSTGSGGGRFGTLVTDSDGAVGSGSYPGHTATTNAPSSRAVMWSLVLSPEATGPNQDPTAAFTANCPHLSCSFDATTSFDPEGPIADYDWDFGDGESGTGASPNHQYGSADDFDVTLTVTDSNGATDAVTHTVTTTEPPASALSFVGADHGVAGAKKVKSANVPNAVQAGDTLVLVFTRASGATWTGPSGVNGFVQRDNVVNGSLTSTVWTKTATAADAGATVRMDSPSYSLGALTLAAYHGVDSSTAPTVVHSTDSSTANHVTPSANAAAGDWAVSYWGDKSAATSSWTAPPSVTVRDTAIDDGGWRFDALLADSGGPVSGGQYGGLTASTDSAGALGAMFTILLSPEG